MKFEVTSEELTAFDGDWRTDRPHVVILGAGASRAACPNGDVNGQLLPLMADIADVLGLGRVLKDAGIDPTVDFESAYSALYERDPASSELKQIEERVQEYFSNLELPAGPTLYDFLVLSLRNKDAIFTFNWDPLLVDAWTRSAEIVGTKNLPHIFHLHGNVRVSFCEACGYAMHNARLCHHCNGKLARSRLMYPVKKKNYSDDPFINSQWLQARDFIGRALILTIFGYSAPATDQEAMLIFRDVWKDEDPEDPVKRVEIIDIRDRDELAMQWKPLVLFGDHYDTRDSLYKSKLLCNPRRSCEALVIAGYHGLFVEPNTLTDDVGLLHERVRQLVIYEH